MEQTYAGDPFIAQSNSGEGEYSSYYGEEDENQ